MSIDLPANNPPTQDDRVLAALAHIRILIPFVGLIAPMVFWATQKSKSPYVHFQALQAVAYHLTMLVAVGMGCYMASFFGIFWATSLGSGSRDTVLGNIVASLFGLGFFPPFAVFGVIFIGMIGYMLYGAWGAIRALQGTAFRYILVGRRVEAFLQSETAGAPAPAV